MFSLQRPFATCVEISLCEFSSSADIFQEAHSNLENYRCLLHKQQFLKQIESSLKKNKTLNKI